MGSLQLHIKDLKRRGEASDSDMFQKVVDGTTTYTASFNARGQTWRRSSDEFFDAQEYLGATFSIAPRASRSSPQLLIAIDFGMTGTGMGRVLVILRLRSAMVFVGEANRKQRSAC